VTEITWTKMSDKMPPHGDLYLFANSLRSEVCYWHEPSIDYPEGLIIDQREVFFNRSPTHWAELPLPESGA
jgi:hypothetical protein